MVVAARGVLLCVALLTLAPAAMGADSFLRRMASAYSQGRDLPGLLPRAEHGTVWRSSTAIDSFSIGYELKQRRTDVRGALPRDMHGTVWQNANTVDAFAVGYEPDEEGAADEDIDVCGLIPVTGRDELR